VNALISFLLSAGSFARAHWVSVAVAAVLVLFEVIWVWRHRPEDLTGNGITIGQAKAFDNRALALRLERLTHDLEQIKVLDQGATANVGAFQAMTSTETRQTASLSGKVLESSKSPSAGDKEGAKSVAPVDKGAPRSEDASGFKPVFGLEAGDLISNQLNLASQIFNLQTLYERSLSDRMINNDARLQTVLGFQVSITPPAGYEDCVGVVEVDVRRRSAPQAQIVGAAAAAPARGVLDAGPAQVSLVALMPQEKTYNAESVSSSERSIDGSAVSRVLTLGVTDKRSARQLFIHRDSDTIAFERPRIAGGPLTFGWEFRPVLGRRTVSPGIRQMLAVVAIDEPDTGSGEVELLITTRSYWRRYARSRQTSAPFFGWIPWRVDRAFTHVADSQTLLIAKTEKVQTALAPKVTNIHWVNSGNQRATVIVQGANFFSGTQVVIGGTLHREENGTLTLKSDQSLEFETTLNAIATGDAVLKGRFGPSVQLLVPETGRAFNALDISNATIRPLRDSKLLRISLSISGYDKSGTEHPLTLDHLKDLPDGIMFVGDDAVPMPYDYSDRVSPQPTTPASPGSSVKSVNVSAWVSAKTLARNPSVSYRIPFCGIDYQASKPLSFTEPTVVRMGCDDTNTVFRVSYAQGFSTDFSVELDTTYIPGSSFLTPINGSITEYRLTVPTSMVSRFQNLVVRTSKGEPYLLRIPEEEKPAPKVSFDTSAGPPQVKKGDRGPVEWTGSSLDAIAEVLIVRPTSTTGQSNAPQSQQFAVYGGGKNLRVYLAAGATDVEGRMVLECTTSDGAKVTLPLFVIS
jgi:hypothetical protein